MIWPFSPERNPKIVAEQQRLRADIAATRAIRVRLQGQWPAVLSIASALVSRRDENGFGEELEVAWTPRRRGDARAD